MFKKVKQDKSNKQKEIELERLAMDKDKEERESTIKTAREKFKDNYKIQPYETMRDYLLGHIYHVDSYYSSYTISEDILDKLIRLEAAFNHKERKPKL